MKTLEIKADGSDGFYADKQAEAELSKLGHTVHFHKHGGNSCWQCGRYAKLDFTDPANSIWTLSGRAFEESCEWVGVPYAQVQDGDFVSIHSINGATYGPPVKIDRILKTQVVTSKLRFRRYDGRIVDKDNTCTYCSFVRRKEQPNMTGNIKVKVTAYRGVLVIEPIDPDTPHAQWTPIGPGKIGNVIGDTRNNLGVSDEALALLRQVRKGRDDLGDVDWWACNDGTFAFGWIGGFNRLAEPSIIEGSQHYQVPDGHHVQIPNDPPAVVKEIIDQQLSEAEGQPAV